MHAEWRGGLNRADRAELWAGMEQTYREVRDLELTRIDVDHLLNGHRPAMRLHSVNGAQPMIHTPGGGSLPSQQRPAPGMSGPSGRHRIGDPSQDQSDDREGGDMTVRTIAAQSSEIPRTQTDGARTTADLQGGR